MAGKVLSMKVTAAVVAVAAGERVNVALVCREAGVSRKTFYKWVARYRAEGVDGLQERSRRPHRVRHRSSDDVEDAIVRLRKTLADAGLDHGAASIRWHLALAGDVHVVPAVSTIHRILARRGLVVANPKKRPKSSWHRFEAPVPNDTWQIDAMDWTTARGIVRVFSILDDHSRMLMACRAVSQASGEQAWAAFCEAAARWGLPTRMLSDNGLCFSGKTRGFEVMFEANLRELGIRPVNGRPYHPQTTGKIERFHQTLKRWLARQPRARSLAELQAQLDRFTEIYNQQRPHQGIGRVTPSQRFHATRPAAPPTSPLEHPTRRATATEVIVNQAGSVQMAPFLIQVGSDWNGCTATVFSDQRRATIFINGQLVRHLELDHSRVYQPSGKPRGGPKRPRQLPSGLSPMS